MRERLYIKILTARFMGRNNDNINLQIKSAKTLKQ